ncbi:MAG: glycoside hydrolase family 31 protein [Gorillibacterium sp.]|nr:glycoside hydrolase family 31 protein [Gorillibacterium sp.]
MDIQKLSCAREYIQSIEKDESFYGLGLQMKSFQQRGTRKRLKTNADPTHDNGSAHVVIPFLVSTKGYGLFCPDAVYPEFDIGCTDPDVLKIDLGEGVHEVIRIKGKDMKDVIRGYHELTGHPQLPPLWGLGLHYRGYLDWNGEELLAAARKFREMELPCDIFGLEPGWHSKSYPCTYEWNKERFPDPKAFLEELHRLGMRLHLWEHPWVNFEAKFADEIKPYSAPESYMGGIAPDFATPQARKLFADHHRHLLDMGVDGFKLDECDGSDHTGNWFFPDDAVFPSGLTGAQMHNQYGHLYQKTLQELYREYGKRTLLLCRGNTSGASSYPTVCYSDLYKFRDYLTALVNSGICHVLWSPEIRETADEEDFIRRAQLMFFSHHPQVNAWYNGIAPWDISEEVFRIFGSYARLRMRLLPYIYGGFRASYETGDPFIRPLVLDYPEDFRVHGIDDQFLFGGSILAAPVYREKSREVYLPEGLWYDYWNGRLLEGGVSTQAEAPLDRIPLYVKAGAVIPYAPVRQYAEGPAIPESLDVYAGANGQFNLYFDDGESLRYQDGEYEKWSADYAETSSGAVLHIRLTEGKGGILSGRKLRVRFIGAVCPARVLYPEGTGVQIPAEMEPAEQEWSYDRAKRILEMDLVLNETDVTLCLDGRLGKEQLEGQESWAPFLNKRHAITGRSRDKDDEGWLELWREGRRLTPSLYEAARLGTVIGEAARKSAGEERFQELQAGVPVSLSLILENDRVKPASCLCIAEVQNDSLNPQVTIRLDLCASPGWAVSGVEDRLILPAGVKRIVYYELSQTGEHQVGSLDARLTATVELVDGTALYERSGEASWGGYVTAWNHAGVPYEVEGRNGSALVDVSPLLQGDDGGCTLQCHVWSPVKLAARIEFGADLAAEIVWNKEEVLQSEGQEIAKPGTQLVPITLSNGWNSVLLRLRKREWEEGGGFYFRIACQWGSTLSALKYALESDDKTQSAENA